MRGSILVCPSVMVARLQSANDRLRGLYRAKTASQMSEKASPGPKEKAITTNSAVRRRGRRANNHQTNNNNQTAAHLRSTRRLGETHQLRTDEAVSVAWLHMSYGEKSIRQQNNRCSPQSACSMHIRPNILLYLRQVGPRTDCLAP